MRCTSAAALRRTSALTIDSTRANSPWLTGLGCEKSKRRRSGATSEPFWVTWVPSTSRSAACSRCVAEWLSTIAWRSGIHLGVEQVAAAQRLRAVPVAGVAEEHAAHLQGVVDRETAGRAGQRAGVADLAAGFGVERRAIQDQQSFLALAQPVDMATAAHDAKHLAAAVFQGLVAEEHGRRQLAGQLGRHLSPRLELAGGAGAFALLVHGLLEAGHVDVEAALACDVGGEVDRET